MSSLRCPVCERESLAGTLVCPGCGCRLDLDEKMINRLREEKRSRKQMADYVRLLSSVLALVTVLALFIVFQASAVNFFWVAILAFAIVRGGAYFLGRLLQRSQRIRAKYPKCFTD